MDDVTPDRVTFWFGCNMLRHGDIIHVCIDVMERMGIAVDAVGGPSYCCGVMNDGNLSASNSMGRRSVNRLGNKGNERVVTWCPSCHIQLDDFISDAHPLPFDYGHFVSLLHANRDRLRPLLTRPVPRRGLLHQHSGFERRAPVNAMVAELLGMVPGYRIEAPEERWAPGHMCSPLSSVPAALQSVLNDAVAQSDGYDDLVTIFHSCHRDLVAVESVVPVRVVNYVHILAEAIGLPYSDGYKALRNSVAPMTVPDATRMAAAGREMFERAILPELGRPRPKLRSPRTRAAPLTLRTPD